VEHFTLDIKPGVRGTLPVGLAREQKRIVLDKAWKIDPENLEEVLASGGYRGLEKILSSSFSPAGVIEEVKKSGLRGRGGAGFPTGMKWEFTRRAPGEEKYVICNADEGEPGTFKDRELIEKDPHEVIEGVIMRVYAIEPISLIPPGQYFGILTAHPLVGIFGSTYMLVFGAFLFLVPFLMNVLHASAGQLGLVESAQGIGMIAGSLLAAQIARRLRANWIVAGASSWPALRHHRPGWESQYAA
jgi:hypothetical protein